MFFVKLISGLGAIAVIWLLVTIFFAGGVAGIFTSSSGSGGMPFQAPTAFINLDRPATYVLRGGKSYELGLPYGYTTTMTFVNGNVTIFDSVSKNKRSRDCRRGPMTIFQDSHENMVVIGCTETTELKVLSVEPGKQY